VTIGPTMARGEPPAHLKRRALVLCALVSALDGYDVLVVAVTIPAMAREWGLTPAAFGVPLAATSLAMALGASLLGALGDRLGRRPLIVGSFALAAITTLAVPLVDTIAQLTLLRFLTGLGLGASLANALALGSEFAPRGMRSRVVTGIYAISGLGGVIGGVITPWLMDAGGWHAPYLFGGGAPLAICAVLLAMLPEAPGFAEGERPEATQRRTASPLRLIRELFTGRLALATAFIWLLFFISSFSAYLISGWLPTLMYASGWSLADGARAITAFSLGGVVAGVSLGWLTDRDLARAALMAAYLATGLALVALVSAPPVLAWWFVLTMLLGAATTGVMYVLPGIAARVYPASLGATGIGSASAIGRIGGTLAPLAGSGLLLLGFDGVTLLLFLVVPMALGFALSLLAPLVMRIGPAAIETPV
jgi:AAHS family 4-hydroxybenzoate transporter-like MFS transporter